MKRTLIILLLALVGSLILKGQELDTIRVRVHDHVMTLYASGTGSPAIILESGLSSTHRTWQKVQPRLAGSKVVSYDRPGYLNSDSCSKTRDAITVAKELKEALTKAGIKPPYIITGWSLGGAFAGVFTGMFPNEVVGMVLVDPVAEEAFPRFMKEQPQFIKEDSIYLREVMSSNRIGEKKEVIAFDSSLDQARISDTKHSTPTYLLIAAGKAPGGQNRDPSNPLYKIWIEELEKWGRKRPNLKYEIIRNSGHNIARDQPDTVLHAVRTIVKQYQVRIQKRSANFYRKPGSSPGKTQKGIIAYIPDLSHRVGRK